MTERVTTSLGIHPGQWRVHGDLFKPKTDGTQTMEVIPQKPLVFTDEELYYLGTLMVSLEGIKVLRELKATLEPNIRTEIENYLASLARRFKDNGVSLKGYFEGDANNAKGPLKILEGKITVFERMTLQQRQAVLQTNTDTALILGPISHLAKDEVGFWLRITHLDYLRIGNSLSS